MRLLILSENYPHLNNIMGDVFVHVRVKEYAKRHQVMAFSFFHQPAELVYEGVPVRLFGDMDSLVKAIGEYGPDKILIHFYQPWMLDNVIRMIGVPVVIWVHGYEALGWYRRLFNYTLYSPVFLKFVASNTVQQYHFRRLIKYANNNPDIRFVFVSNWMRKITSQDTLCNIRKTTIIANPIDTSLFRYREKGPEMRKKVLLLRSFVTRKYANDISVKAILELSRREAFKEFSFTLMGQGGLFDTLTQPLRKFSNIELRKQAVRQVEIPALHEQYGVFLCPTRQDAQGVSMCEAMSSGLVPVTSRNTAIPEFVDHNVSGILTSSPREIADALQELLEKPDKFSELSANAAKSIRDICNIVNIVDRELSIIES
ncbi:MAG TPA: glycosyltransferase family 4 protein [Puia sp.]|jgi:glycosyltransferase involved in cell wall biosynthesis|nr:glycosyltransferase family 4 protein [Puia sp.]